MLWMKAWRETRWKLAFLMSGFLASLITAASGGGLGTAEHAANLMGLLSFLSIVASITLAGAGITTQSPFRRNRGLHESMYFTLSLPVSRFRLLAVRAGFGLLETAGMNVFMIASAWSLFPLTRASSTFVDLPRAMSARPASTSSRDW